jgi:hypothetical protein
MTTQWNPGDLIYAVCARAHTQHKHAHAHRHTEHADDTHKHTHTTLQEMKVLARDYGVWSWVHCKRVDERS